MVWDLKSLRGSMGFDSPAPTLAAGELLWDMMPSGARLGGTTANFAVLTARLGDFSALVSCVGDDQLGREATERLGEFSSDGAARARLDLSGVQISRTLPTGTVSVKLDGEGRPQYKINNPVAWDAIELSAAVLELAGRAGAICFGTLAQRNEVSRHTIRTLVRSAGAQCVRVCDLNIRSPFCTREVLQWCLEQADVLKASDEELPEVARLLGKPGIAAGIPCSRGRRGAEQCGG